MAITNRLFAPELFEPVRSEKDREHLYYRISVGIYIVLAAWWLKSVDLSMLQAIGGQAYSGCTEPVQLNR